MLTMWTQAHNSEKYLPQCIESVLNQSYTDFEYIIVDDGSTDATWTVIEDYAKKDPRICAFHDDDNLGGVRYNLFRDTVKGDYFAMLDSDDWLEPNFFNDLLCFCEGNDLDIGVCGSRYFMESGEGSGVLRNPSQTLVFRIDQTPQYFSTIHPFLRPIWGKLIRTEIFRNANLSVLDKFLKMHYKGFDTAFSMGIFESCERVGMLNRCLHNYRIRETSTFSEFSPQRYDAYDQLYEQTINVLEKFGTLSPQNQVFTSLVFLNGVKDTLDIALKSPLPISEKVSYILDILNKPRVLELRKTDYANEGFRMLIPYILWVLDRTQA